MEPCSNQLIEFRAFATNIGVMSFGALAFLVAVVAIFIELSRDQIVVSVRFHYRVLWSARILAAEVLVWVCVELGRVVPLAVVPCNGIVIASVQVLMVLGIAIITGLLTNVVREVGVMVRDGYVHKKE